MKQFKTLILSLFLVLAIAILGNIVLGTLGLFFNYDVFNIGMYSNQNVSLNIKLLFVFKAVALLIFVFGVYILIKDLKFLVRRDFFNSRLIRCFSKSGKLFLASGIIGFFISILAIFNTVIFRDYGSQMYLNIDSKSLYIILMILGLFLMLFAKVLNRGSLIQQENELTI